MSEHQRDPESQDLDTASAWLIRLRWFAFAGISLTIIAANSIGVLSVSIWPLLVIAFCIGLYNLMFSTWTLKRVSALGYRFILLQSLLDVSALTALIHWTGGVENPFVMCFSFQVAIAAILLPRRTARALGVVSAVLHGGIVILEFEGLLPHHPLVLADSLEGVNRLHSSGAFVTGYLVAFVLMLAGVMYFVQSVTERRRKAEDLRREHERVATSRERLARIGELSAGVAHTVRNPLHGLLNCVEIMRRKWNGNGGMEEILDMMDEGLQRIESVTQRLLTLTREEPQAKVLVNPSRLLADAVRFVDAKASKHGVSIESEFDESSELEADPVRLSEAFVNLLDNAVDASRNNGTGSNEKECGCGEDRHLVQVRSALVSEHSRESAAISIEVEDKGSGIPDDIQERVFSPFFTTKAVGEGTGLGLAIAKRTIEELGGKIEIASRNGEGTTVRVLLPLAPDV